MGYSHKLTLYNEFDAYLMNQTMDVENRKYIERARIVTGYRWLPLMRFSARAGAVNEMELHA